MQATEDRRRKIAHVGYDEALLILEQALPFSTKYYAWFTTNFLGAGCNQIQVVSYINAFNRYDK